MLHGKRSFSLKHTQLDSPAYDASEEDNDPLTDDGGSTMSMPPSRTHHGIIPSSLAVASNSNVPSSSAARAQQFQVKRTQPHHTHHPHHASRITAILSSDIDDGVDSPTYDGDVESSSTAVAKERDLPSTSGTPLASPTLDTPSEMKLMSNLTLSTLQRDNEELVSSATSHQNPEPTPTSTVPGDVPIEAEIAACNTATLSQEEIQSWVRNIIYESNSRRTFTIKPPPVGRPVRIYADGVYDLFHYGHALQLRQAKLSFPSVYLMAGVNSDEQVSLHKSDAAMNHAERCESVRHCRWVDEVVEEAPWVIDQTFLDKWAIDYVAHDEDPYASVDHDDVYGYVKSQGKFLPTRRTPGISTSILLGRIVSYYRQGTFDGKLEKIGQSELKAQGSKYDNDNN